MSVATLRDARRREARESPRARARAVRLVRWSRPRRASRRASAGAPHLVRGPRSSKLRETTKTPDAASLFRARLSTAPADPPRTFRSSFPQVELIAQRREARRTKMLQEKAALHAERKTHGVDLDGVRRRVWWMRNAPRARSASARRARRTRRRRRASSRQPPQTADTAEAHDHVSFTNKRVAVLVRVRPLSAAERAARAVDVVTCVPSTRGSPAPRRCTHAAHQVDGTRHVESSRFDLDGAFDARASDADVYAAAIAAPRATLPRGRRRRPRTRRPRALSAQRRGATPAGANATVFAYGQTGSGKTHTMTGCTSLLARDVCLGAREKNLRVEVSHYEVYGGKCFDLLADARASARAARRCARPRARGRAHRAPRARAARDARARGKGRGVSQDVAHGRERVVFALARGVSDCVADEAAGTRKRAGPPRATRVLSRRGSRWLTSPVPSVARTGARRSPSVSGGRARRSTRRCSR